MTTESFDRRLAAWLDEDARGRVGDHLTEVLVATRATRQRPAWSSLERWLPVTPLPNPRSFVTRPVLTVLVLAALIIAMAGVYLFVAGRPSRPPFGQAQNGRIVYLDGSQIISVPVDKISDSLVAGRVQDAGGLAVSPDGRVVAYAVAERVSITGIPTNGDRGSGAVDITAPGMTAYGSPAWSPAGDQIAFVGADPRSDHVFIANRDGSNLHEVGLSMIEERHVVAMVGFSPDGRWLAFAESPDPGTGRLIVVALDGTAARVVPSGPVNMGDGGGASWSPDPATERILYLRTDGTTRYVEVRTGDEVLVARGFWPSWSPTGDRISYWDNGTKIIATPVGDAARAPIEVFPSFSGACQDHPELAGQALCGPVTWSPDGTRVIGTEVTGNGLLSLRSDGSGVPVLFDLDTNVNPGEGGIVVWQPIYPR